MPATFPEPIGPLSGPERDQVSHVARLVADAESLEVGEKGHLRIHVEVDGHDDCAHLPVEARDLIGEVLIQLAAGKAVRVVALDTQLTTNQAAELLGVSRPYLIKLLDQGAIPHTKVNRHRRINLQDALAYQEEQHRKRREALDELYEESADLGMYE